MVNQYVLVKNIVIGPQLKMKEDIRMVLNPIVVGLVAIR